MSNHVRALAWLLASAWCCAPLRAQAPAAGGIADRGRVSQRIDSLYSVVDSLRPLLWQIGRAGRAADSIRRLRRAEVVKEPLDTAVIGPFQVVAPQAGARRARLEFERAWRALEPVAGQRAASLRGLTFLVSVDHTPPLYDFMPRKSGTRRVHLTSWLQPSQRDAAMFALARELDRGTPGSLRLWSGAPLLAEEPDWSVVYRNLVLSASGAAARCIEGNLEACADALSLRPPGDAWERWYTPAQLRVFVESRWGEASSVAGRACVKGDDAACVQVLRGSGPPSPLNSAARRALAQLALARGGAGAYERLLRDSTASVGARLEAAAHQPERSLIVEWRQRALAARPAHDAGLGVSLFSVLFWGALFLLLALRSTRWRIG